MELITIQSNHHSNCVSAYELYQFLGVKSNFTTWIKRKFEICDHVENVDFVKTCFPNLESKLGKHGGHNAIDYIITLDCAKEITITEPRNAKAKEYRRLLIELEKKYRQKLQYIENPTKVIELESRVLLLEQSIPDHGKDFDVRRFLNVSGYGKKYQVNFNSDPQRIGKIATKLYREQFQSEPKKVLHPTYPNGVNVYPYELLLQAFEQWKTNL